MVRRMGGLIPAKVRGDPGYRPALVGQADALQPPPQPRGKRALSQPLPQVGSLPGRKGNVERHRSGHAFKHVLVHGRASRLGFSDTL
jgi:hypothetical protein